MKIAHIIHHEGNGGSEFYLKSLFNNIEADYVLITSKKGNVSNLFESKGYKVYEINFENAIKAILAGIKLSFIIRKEKIDIIHSHFFKEQYISLIGKVLSFRKVKLVRTWHIITESKGLTKAAIMINLMFTNKVIAVSEKVKENILNIYKKANVQVIYNGVNFEKFCSNKELSLRESLNIKDDEFIFGVVGRVSKEKGQDFLIESLKNMENINYKCLIVGAGGYFKEQLENRVKEYNLENKVMFLGFREDVVEIYNTLDLLIVPSENEALGYSPIETLACEIPVIATNVGGLPEVIIDEYNGSLVEYGNVSMLKNKIIKYVENKEYYNNIKNNTRKSVIEKFSITKMLDETKKIYKGEI